MDDAAKRIAEALELISPDLHLPNIEVVHDADLVPAVVVVTLRDGEERHSKLGMTPESEIMTQP